ncbi:MAG TPA: Spy/CpxP family protein refolding chaperone [Geomonas sp.]|nr:Spy/CpxP family protein refolding chaperone [Geomonas sp.]
MRNGLKTILLVGCIVSSTAVGGLALAAENASAAAQGTELRQGCRAHEHGHFRRHGFKKMVKALKLTDQQKAQAQALFRSNRQAMKPLFVNLVTAKHQLGTMVASGSAEPSAIQTQAAAVATAETNLALQKAQNTKKFLALLTPDQVNTYQAFQAKREARFQKFMTRMESDADAE